MTAYLCRTFPLGIDSRPLLRRVNTASHYDASGHQPHASLFVYPGQIHVEGESLEALTVRLRAPVEQSQNFAQLDTVPRAP